MPILVLWGKKGNIEQWYKPLTIWQKYCVVSRSLVRLQAVHYKKRLIESKLQFPIQSKYQIRVSNMKKDKQVKL